IRTIIATAHQLGRYRHVRGELIRTRTEHLREVLAACGIDLHVHPGATVQLDLYLPERLVRGDLVTLADQRRHLLVEVPAKAPAQLEELAEPLQRGGVTVVVARPERHPALACVPERVEALVERGCLMQITAGSLLGDFGVTARRMAEWMLEQQLVHFVASDGRGPRARRPLLRLAYHRVVQLAGPETARRLMHDHPAAVLRGEPIETQRPANRSRVRRRWMPWRRAA